MRVNSISNNINFQAGLSSKIKSEIRHCDAQKIAEHFCKMGYPSDFKNNKVVAWCCLKCFDIIRSLNEMYGLNLGLPRGFMLENFNILKNVNLDADAFCTTLPSDLYKFKCTIPENVIFINEYPEYNYNGSNLYWDKIDEISDLNYANKAAPTDSFLHIFLHEFSHVIHNKNLLKKIGSKSYFELILKVLDENFINDFKRKYGAMFSELCPHAATTPYEAVACDLGKRINDNLDPQTLIHVKNPLMNTPYVEKPIIVIENEYDKTLRELFNGKFE